MARVTRQNVLSAFEYFVDMVGKQKAGSYKDVGKWAITYEEHVGWKIEEMQERGISYPLGDGGRTSQEMYDCLWFAMRAIEFMARQKEMAR